MTDDENVQENTKLDPGGPHPLSSATKMYSHTASASENFHRNPSIVFRVYPTDSIGPYTSIYVLQETVGIA